MRHIERIPPLAARIVRIWLANPSKTLQELIDSVTGQDEQIDDMELVKRLEAKFPNA